MHLTERGQQNCGSQSEEPAHDHTLQEAATQTQKPAPALVPASCPAGMRQFALSA